MYRDHIKESYVNYYKPKILNQSYINPVRNIYSNNSKLKKKILDMSKDVSMEPDDYVKIKNRNVVEVGKRNLKFSAHDFIKNKSKNIANLSLYDIIVKRHKEFCRKNEMEMTNKLQKMRISNRKECDIFCRYLKKSAEKIRKNMKL